MGAPVVSLNFGPIASWDLFTVTRHPNKDDLGWVEMALVEPTVFVFETDGRKTFDKLAILTGLGHRSGNLSA